MSASAHKQIRDAIITYLDAKRSGGGIWDGLDLPQEKHLARLTDARFLQIQDGALGKIVTWVQDSHGSVSQGRPDPGLALVSLIKGTDYKAKLNLYIPFKPTPAAARANAETLLHEMVHHAEYRAGLMNVPGAEGNKSVQERNTIYFEQALKAVVSLETRLSHFEADFATAKDEDLCRDLNGILRDLLEIRLLERGKAVSLEENKDGKLAIRPDLAFLKRDLNINLSEEAINAYFVSGRGAPLMQAIFRDVLPVMEIAGAAGPGENALVSEYEKEVRRFAALHKLDEKELAERLIDAERRAIADYKKTQQELQQLISELIETYLEPLRKLEQ